MRERRPRPRRRGRTAILALACAVLAVAALAAALRVEGHPRTRPRARAARSTPSAVARRPRRSRPAGPAELWRRSVHRVLAYTPYVAAGTRRRKEVALTFDDGPGPATPRLLRFLRRRHVPATFFVVGRGVAAAPRLVRREVAQGDVVGDHTQDHFALARLSALGQGLELDRAAAAIERAGAPAPELMRPPYGSFDAATLGALRRRRMLMVLWSVDTKDYRRPGAARIVQTALSGARAGAIILMHDGGGDRSETLAALPRIVHKLRLRGYRLVTVPQLVHDDPPPRGQAPPRSLAGS